MPLDESMLGVRVSVRRLVPGEVGPTGGPAMTDVIGRVVALGDGHATIERRDGELVDVRLADVVTARRVPDGARRRRTRPAMDFAPSELARICTRGWPPIELEALGEWSLRAADGFTGRANSVAVHGDPGVELAVALSRVDAFYTARDLQPRAQVVDGSRWDDGFADAGWRGIGGTHDHALVQVADLRDALPFAADESGVTVADTVDDDWLALYGRAATGTPAAARRVLEGPPTVGFLRIGDPLVAIGRVAVTGEWAGLGAVEVAPSHRRQGLGRRIVDASLHWASEHGADKAYLQTMRHNDAALALYARYGFVDHHTYRYLTI
ncbi:GNAT family N-acetyltransferase [Solicola gregarius]|uniref:GNAT family N-acetyltransferase n=1 Tax=Solicola gregarius TaxID=2908642 RepID=A0AA46TJE6_9ACTN|nr:GNAT family N-acetyltransferase [Solicola gregarius]UYM06200.1 GNAT family N-acetyltransferase [Solicola gregarius]